MFEKFIENIILNTFGDYIENFDKNNISAGIWSGRVILDSVLIKSTAINKMKLPFKFIYGRIAKLDFTFDWKSNFTQPTIIIMENLHIIVSLLKQEDWEYIDYISYQVKMQSLNYFASQTMLKIQEALAKKKNEKSDSYWDRVLIKVLDNIQITIKNVHFRVEDTTVSPNYCLGITLQEMLAVNTNDKWEQVFVDRSKKENKNVDIYKLLKITNFGIYLKLNETNLISKVGRETIQKELEAIFPPLSNYAKDLDYLIQPMSLVAKLKQKNDSNEGIDIPRFTLWIDLEKFNIDFQKEQFNCLIRLLNVSSSYQRFQFNYYETRRYNFYKPRYKIKDSINKLDYFTSKDVKNPNAVMWWKFAGRTVIKRLKFIRGNLDEFDIPPFIYNEWKLIFPNLYKAYFKAPQTLTDKEKEMLEKIVTFVDLPELYKWVSPVLQEFDRELTKEQNKKLKSTYLGSFFGSKVKEEDLLSLEEIQTIEQIYNNAITEMTEKIITVKNEIKMQIFFVLNEGFFNFSKSLQNTSSSNKTQLSGNEAFCFKYKDLKFNLKKGENFTQIESMLRDFNMEMVTIINKNETILPICFKKDFFEKNEEMTLGDEYYIWKLNFRQNSPLDEINSILSFEIKTINFLYHQTFLERVLSFFTVEINQDLVNQAWDKWNLIKENTSKTIKDALSKKNILEVNIEPRKLIIPINKYDFKNSRILTLELGKVKVFNTESSGNYEDQYKLELSIDSISYFSGFNEMIRNANKLVLIADALATMTLCIKPKELDNSIYPKNLVLFEINRIIINLNNYVYTIFNYIIDIMKPAKELDLWSQLNQSKQEIKRNCKAFGKILKKSEIGGYWQEYYGVLSGGYIYFFKDVNDDNYTAYYYIKDTIITEENEVLGDGNNELYYKLKNNYGIIKLKFPNEQKRKQWLDNLRSRIFEMNISYEVKREQLIESKLKQVFDLYEVYFGAKVCINNIIINLFQDEFDLNNKIFILSLKRLDMFLKLRPKDTEVELGLLGLQIFDETLENDFKQIIDSTDPENRDLKLFSINILICEEQSPRYKKVQIEFDIKIGYLYGLWNPNSIRRLLSFLAHHDIYRDKILREIQLPPNKTNEDKFIMPLDTEDVKHQTCVEANSIYIKVATKIKNVRVIWLQPTLRFMFMELRLGETSIYCDLYVDHLEIEGTLGNTQLFDLSNYPYTIRTQQDFKPVHMKEVLGFKENSSLEFKYKSYSTWCPKYKNKNSAHCEVIFNSGRLTYIHELFFRFFNYLFEEFLGAIGPSPEVKDYKNKKNQVPVREKNDIEFMVIDVTFKNPQVLLKPRPRFSEYFLADLGIVKITNSYKQCKGKNRKLKDELRWLKLYHIDMSQLYIVRQDGFKICNPTDLRLDLIFHYMTMEEYKLTDTEIDKSLEMQLNFGKIELNIRQIDFTDLMRCNDLNLMYTDNMYKFYQYSQINAKDISILDKTFPIITDDNLLSMLVTVSFPQFQIKLFKDNQKIITELELLEKFLIYKRTLTNKSEFTVKIGKAKGFQYINNQRDSEFISELFDPINNFDKYAIENYHSEPFKKDMVNINYMIDTDREKTVLININNIKVFVRVDLLNIIKIFFLEGFPNYENVDTLDVPNQYDPNTDNYAGMRVFLEIKNPLLCVLSERIINSEQEMICLTCEIVLGYRKEKVRRIKDEIKNNYREITKLLEEVKDKTQKEKFTRKLNEDKSEIYSMKISLIDICPFISNKQDITKREKVTKPKRKLMDNFMFTYEYNIILRYIPENQYIIQYSTAIDLNKINVKLTYKDLVLFLKSIEFNYNLFDEEYNEITHSLRPRLKATLLKKQEKQIETEIETHLDRQIIPKGTGIKRKEEMDGTEIWDTDEKPNDIIINSTNYNRNFLKNIDEKDVMIDKGLSKTAISSRGFQIILIDDHSNTYYPFLSVIIYDVNLINEYINTKQNIINANSMIKIITYNYLASVWEPIIEKTMVSLEIVQNYADEKISSHIFNITIPTNSEKPYSAFNINISDLTICFLYSTMNSWIDKYLKLKKNYKEEIKKLIENDKDMKISNHTLVNYTGKNLIIYKVIEDDIIKSNKNIKKLYKKLAVIPQNQSFDIEYFDETNEIDLNIDITQNLFKDNVITFELEDIDISKISDNELKIDMINFKKHKVDYFNFISKYKPSIDTEKYEYLYTDIRLSGLKKNISLYSPLIIKNKSPYTIEIKLRRREMKEINYLIEQKKTVGIPFEYLDGEIEFKLPNMNERQTISMKELLNLTKNKNLRFQDKNINLFRSLLDSRLAMNFITITSSYLIRNCLPYDIEITLKKTGEKLFLPKSEKMYIDSLTTEDNLEIHLKFLHFRSKKDIVLYNTRAKEHIQKPIDFTVYDEKDLALTLFAALVEKTDSRAIAIYCKGLIVNNTLLNLRFFYIRNKRLFEVAGQKEKGNVFLLSDETYISFEHEGLFSEPYSLNAIGISTMVECSKGEKVFEFVMHSDLSLVAQDLEVYTTIINFSPRFIFYNKLNCPLVVRLKNSTPTLLLQENDKKPFFFFGQRPNNLVCFRPMETREKDQTSGSMWNYSNGVSLTNNNLLTIQLFSLTNRERKFINMEKKLEGSSTFVIISETTYENSQFIIENYSRNISMKICQENFDRFSEYIDTCSKSVFSWDQNISNVICFEFLIGPLNRRPLATKNSFKRLEIYEDKIIINKRIIMTYPSSEIIHLRTSQYGGFVLKLEVSTDGMRKIIKLKDIIYDVYKFSDKTGHEAEIHLKIEKLGISIISDNRNINKKRNEYNRYEICYLVMKKIYYYSKRTQIENHSASELQLKIQDMQIDNQYAYIVSYPLILKPLAIKPSPESEVPPVFNMVMYLQQDPQENLKVNLINYLIQSCSTSFDSDIVEALMNFLINITIQLKTSLTQISPIFLVPSNSEESRFALNINNNFLVPEWLSKTVSKESSKIFIQTLKTSSIDLVLSFSAQNKNKAFAKYLTSSAVLSSILGTLSNLEKAPIMLNGSEMHNIRGDLSEIIALIIGQYKQATLVQVMKIFGAIDLLGNPINLFHNVGTGVQDFFQKPIQGIIMGPLEGVKGVVAGSVSLVKHTVGGTFTATSKITSGISKGILSITQDDEYINDRETKKITEKPRNFVEGLGFGISSMATGLYSGVKDIVAKPIEGAQQESVKGFGKGILKGVAGLVVKPVSGVLDLFSKTTEGIKNTMNSDDLNMQKQRKPRAFYGRHKLIKSFNAYHADVIELLNKMDEIKKRQMHFYSSEIYKNKKEEIILMVLTTKSMILIDLARKEIKTEIPYSFILEIIPEEKMQSIKFKFRELLYKVIIVIKQKSAARIEVMSDIKVLYQKIKDAWDNNTQDYYEY